jgi:hypothetical protein
LLPVVIAATAATVGGAKMIRRAAAQVTKPLADGVHDGVHDAHDSAHDANSVLHDGSEQHLRPPMIKRRRTRRGTGRTCSRQKLEKYSLAAIFGFAICLGFVSLILGIGAAVAKRSNLRKSTVVSHGNVNNADLHGGIGHQFQRYTLSAPECTHITPDQVAFTLVTQLSVDRLWMMKYHCQRWGSSSPISVAILSNTTTAKTRKSIVELGCDTNQLSVQTLDSNDELQADYPVNNLRTMALSAVRTSHVMYVDIDFWEAAGLHDLLYLPEVRGPLALDPKHTVVVPAFQLNRQCREYRDCPEENIPQMPQDRQDMLNALIQRNGSPFDPTNRGGHGSTMYEKWTQQRSGDLLKIPCIRSNRYEPYMAFRYCHDLPPFQTQFSGYGKNKMTWVMQMRREGYIFSQLGGAFVVHYPHLDSTSRMEWNHGPKEVQPFKGQDGKMYKSRPRDVKGADWTAFKRGRVDAAFVDFRKWLRSNLEDTARIGMCRESEDDDAKLWIDRSEGNQ